MIIQKNKSLYSLGILAIVVSVWGWLSISPEYAVHWIIPNIALVSLALHCTPAYVIYAGLTTILMWGLVYTQHPDLLVYFSPVFAALGPVNYALHAQNTWAKVSWLTVGWLLVEYTYGLSTLPTDVYLGLRKSLLPLCMCICWLYYPDWSRRVASWSRDYTWIRGSAVLIGIVLAQIVLTWCTNALDSTFLQGLNCKHRVVWAGMIALPFLWKLFDDKQLMPARVLTVGIGALMYSAHARLGLIALVSALCARYILLTSPKLFFTMTGTCWVGGALNTLAALEYWLNHKGIRFIAFLNTSFYERFMFWKYFSYYADEAFWWGYGIPRFLRLLLTPLQYVGIDRHMTILPSHTHWLWLDLRLSLGCLGIGLLTTLFMWMIVKYWNHQCTAAQATKIATLFYGSILYTSFYGIFWHIFIFAWLLFAWLVTDFLHQNVLRGTMEETDGDCSTWNNLKGERYGN